MSMVVFLNIPGHVDKVMTVFPPIGIMSMSAVLKEKGHEVAYIDADIDKITPEEVSLLIKEYSPDLVGITLNVSQIYYLDGYLRSIQEKTPEIQILVGGPYVSAVGSGIFADFPAIKFAITHEGEYAIIDFLEYLSGNISINEVRNLIYKYESDIHENYIERISSIDLLPMPDYSLVADKMHKYTGAEPSIGSPSVAIMCTRGCPYKCTFCSSPVTWGRKVTFRSVKSIVNEIKFLKDQFDVKEIFFQDDTLNLRRSWFFELCNAIIGQNLHNDIYFKCPFRVNQEILDRRILEKAREANFWMIFYGVESGNQQMLDSMNKGVTINEVKRAFRLTRECGICSYASFMIGNDGETMDTVQDSIMLLDEIMPDFGGFAIAAPFPGTELYRTAHRKNHVKIKSFKQYQFGNCVMRTSELSIDEIVQLAGKSNRHYKNLKETKRFQDAFRKSGCCKFTQKQGYGLYDLELWHTYVRRSKKKVSCMIPNSGHSSRVLLKLLADYPDIHINPVVLDIYVNDSLVHKHIFYDDKWTVISIPYNNNVDEDVTLHWEVDRTWRPKDYNNSSDSRELGVVVEKIWAE